MGDLDNLGKLKVKNIETKNLALEAATGGGTNSINISVQNNLAASYVLTMPQNPPETRDTLQSVPGGFAGFFRWDKSIEYETDTGISADSANNNNKIFSATSNGTAAYGINDIWKRITNWFTTTELANYNLADNDQNIVHETDSDQFFIGSKYPIIAKIPVPPTYDSIGWLRIETESFSVPQAENINDGLPDPPAFLFTNDNLVISHDAFYGSSAVNNNMVIVKHPYTYNLTSVAGCPAYPDCVPYVEWEYVGVPNLSTIDATFGFVNETAPEDSGLAANTQNWANEPTMSNSGGVIAHIGDPSTNTSWLHNGVLSAATNMVTPTTTWSVKCCDRIQFCVDASSGEAEIVYVRYNNRMGVSIKTGLTISNPTDKYYSMSTQAEKWRIAREPKLYQGSLSPNTYILNL